ncbi:MAG: hypothetical protein IT382_21520 [Deltaproteobacteria bacterium]|nr:hypothetical protein [Deltaproteobacteria bacterium]
MAVTLLTERVGIPITTPGASLQQLVRPIPDLQVALLAFAAAALGAVLAAAWPARKAAAMNPVDALRST